jgi:hypothetical protein
MQNIKVMFLVVNFSFLLVVCGCGESKEEKAAREFRDAAKEAASQIEKMMKK